MFPKPGVDCLSLRCTIRPLEYNHGIGKYKIQRGEYKYH